MAGIYETYDGQVVSILDERGEHCRDESHQEGKALPDLNRSTSSSGARHG
jgi:hypothetical protein